MNNYPLGAEYDSRAPWNEVEQPEREIEVTCSNTLSKSSTITVEDYTVDGYDEEGYPHFNYSDCKLVDSYTEQQFTAKQALDLAAEFAKRIYTTLDSKDHSGLKSAAVEVFNACEGWEEDELEVVID